RIARRTVRERPNDSGARSRDDPRTQCGSDLRHRDTDRSKWYDHGRRLLVGSRSARSIGARRSTGRKGAIRTRQAAAASMNKSFDVRIGINPISWTNDDLPSLGGETPLEVARSE